MQRITASMNNGVKVIFSPSLFSKDCLIRSLHKTMLVTSASAKLVTWALTFLLSTMCLAIILRMRSISMISTPAPCEETGLSWGAAFSMGFAGAAPAVEGAVACVGCAGAALVGAAV